MDLQKKEIQQNASISLQKELDFLYEWLIFVVNFYIEKEYKHFDTVIESIEAIYSKNLVKGLRAAFNNIVIDSIELPTDHLTELNRRLKERFGKDLFDMNKKLESKIQAIIKREKVKNDEEYRLVKAFLDTIYDVEGQEEEVRVLERLNFEYEENR